MNKAIGARKLKANTNCLAQTLINQTEIAALGGRVPAKRSGGAYHPLD